MRTDNTSILEGQRLALALGHLRDATHAARLRGQPSPEVLDAIKTAQAAIAAIRPDARLVSLRDETSRRRAEVAADLDELRATRSRRLVDGALGADSDATRADAKRVRALQDEHADCEAMLAECDRRLGVERDAMRARQHAEVARQRRALVRVRADLDARLVAELERALPVLADLLASRAALVNASVSLSNLMVND